MFLFLSTQPDYIYLLSLQLGIVMLRSSGCLNTSRCDVPLPGLSYKMSPQVILDHPPSFAGWTRGLWKASVEDGRREGGGPAWGELPVHPACLPDVGFSQRANSKRKQTCPGKKPDPPWSESCLYHVSHKAFGKLLTRVNLCLFFFRGKIGSLLCHNGDTVGKVNLDLGNGKAGEAVDE